MTEPFLFSVPSGEAIGIELFHIGIFGQTQFSGKSTLLKRLATYAVEQGYKVLIFDTKETEPDYAGFGQSIPICMRETKDTLVVIGLLESIFKRRLTPYYATLSRLLMLSKDYDEVIKRAKDEETKIKSGWLKDAYHTLYDLLERLQNETSKIKTVTHLELVNGINRMDINNLSIEAQQIVVRNAFEDALTIYKSNLILVVDEAFKFIPQGYSSAATRAIMNVMTQGAKTGLFGWISTQYLAVTDKDPLKACALKFLGTQDHPTEVKHTLDLVPELHKYKAEDIMKLKLGHYILVKKRPPFIGEVYALPVGAPTNAGVSVAQGKMTPEQLRDRYLKKRQTESDPADLKELEEMKAKYAEAEGLRRAALEHADNVIQANEDLKKEIEKLTDLTKKQTGELAELHLVSDFVNPLTKLVKTILKETSEIYPQQPTGKQIKGINFQPDELIIKVEKPKETTITIGTQTVRERILYIIAVENKGQLTSLVEIENSAREHGWSMTRNSISPKALNIIDEGLLIAEKKDGQSAYRMPGKVKIIAQEDMK